VALITQVKFVEVPDTLIMSDKVKLLNAWITQLQREEHVSILKTEMVENGFNIEYRGEVNLALEEDYLE